MREDRRRLITGISGLGAGLILGGCGGANNSRTGESSSRPEPDEDKKGGEVTATEDLMREHGILRRALIVYSEVAVKLRSKPSDVAPDALEKTARLFRTFGEEYHEKKLEESYIFPAVKSAGGEAGSYPDILTLQHERGRAITEYIVSAAHGPKLGANNSEPLARALESFVRMYRAHAAREDTIVFPAWKQTLTAKQLDEMGEKFEEIEHQQFGEDGFEDALKQIAGIESALGLADLSQFTAPVPPKGPEAA